jgi:blue copper oxidase
VSADLDFEFTNPLAIPPLAPSELDADGRRVFELTAAQGQHDFGAGRTDTWGFNGDYLGPTLRVRRGDEVLVNVHNELDEETTVHWHGLHLPAVMDGGPHQPIAPGQTWSPTWRIDQPAARSDTTRTRTARPSGTSTAAWRGCSSSSTTTPTPWTCPRSTGWTTSR